MAGSAFAPQSRPQFVQKRAISTNCAAHLKHELGRLGEAGQQGCGRVERRPSGHMPGCRAVDRRPSGCAAEYACQPPTLVELPAKVLRNDLGGPIEQNHVERRLCRSPRNERTGHDRDIRHPDRGKLFLGDCRQVRIFLERDDAAGKLGQNGGRISARATDIENAIRFQDLRPLDQPRQNRGLEKISRRSSAQRVGHRQIPVGVGEGLLVLRDKMLSRNFEHRGQNPQVRTYDVTDLRVLAAMLEVPREHFVPEDKQALAYADRDLPVTNALGGRTPRYLLKPAVLARLIQGVEVLETDRVLDVGCASGYSSAVLAKLAGSVIALEEDSHLAAIAKEKLAAIGVANVTVMAGPLIAGAPAQAPFDVILLNGATEIVPQNLCRQLNEGGRLACVFGRAPGRATIYRSASGHVTGRPAFDAAAPLLPGFAKPAEFVF